MRVLLGLFRRSRFVLRVKDEGLEALTFYLTVATL
jgi:hypothetical protein